jgi:hypothetical protein
LNYYYIIFIGPIPSELKHFYNKIRTNQVLKNPVRKLMQNYNNERAQFKNLTQRDFLNRLTYDIAAIDFESKQRKKNPEYETVIISEEVNNIQSNNKTNVDDNNVISIINDILLNEAHIWHSLTDSNFLPQSIQPTPRNHAFFCKLNYKQNVMFTLAAKALLNSWLIHETNTSSCDQFFGYLG